MPAQSKPPESEHIPGAPRGSGGPYLVGIAVLVALTVALFVWKRSSNSHGTTQQSATVTTAAKEPDPPMPVHAPPPPPPVEDEPEAGVPEDAGKATTKAAGNGLGPCGGKCTGQDTAALRSALTAHARSVQGCYKRALRTSEVSGNMTVSVQVGSGGQVCNASIAVDNVHSSEVSSCVLSRFRGQTLPAPTGGCVTVNIPISFTIQQ